MLLLEFMLPKIFQNIPSSCRSILRCSEVIVCGVKYYSFVLVGIETNSSGGAGVCSWSGEGAVE